MPKADPEHIMPLGGDLSLTIARLRQIASEKGDDLVDDEPTHPDAELLEICATAVHRRQVAEAAFAAWLKIPQPERDNDRTALHARHVADGGLAQALQRVANIPATTPAGLFAKALAVRSSRTGTALLTARLSLAEDLLNTPALRAALWAPQPERETCQ